MEQRTSCCCLPLAPGIFLGGFLCLAFSGFMVYVEKRYGSGGSISTTLDYIMCGVLAIAAAGSLLAVMMKNRRIALASSIMYVVSIISVAISPVCGWVIYLMALMRVKQAQELLAKMWKQESIKSIPLYLSVSTICMLIVVYINVKMIKSLRSLGRIFEAGGSGYNYKNADAIRAEKMNP